MTDLAGLEIDELQQLARAKTGASRKQLAVTINALFGVADDAVSDRERALMNGILSKLLSDMELAVRQALAEELADDPAAPPALVRMLAKDDIAVARPVLERCGALRDPDLIEVVHHRTMEHQLSICMRGHISESVSDALVATNNPRVISALLSNQNARIARATFAYLAEAAEKVDAYRDPLVRRNDLPPELARKLYWLVSAALRQHLLEHFDVAPESLDDGLQRVVANALRQARDDDANPNMAQALAAELAQTEGFNPERLVQALREGEVALFEALLAQLTGLRQRLVRRLIYEPGGEGLALACRGLGMRIEDFTDIYRLSRDALSANRRQAHDAEARAMILFKGVEQRAAMAMMRRWRRDPDYLEAQLQLLETQPRGDAA